MAGVAPGPPRGQEKELGPDHFREVCGGTVLRRTITTQKNSPDLGPGEFFARRSPKGVIYLPFFVALGAGATFFR